MARLSPSPNRPVAKNNCFNDATLLRGSRLSSTCEERTSNSIVHFTENYSCICLPFSDLLSILRIQCTKNDGVDIVVPPEEEPEQTEQRCCD